MLRLHANQTNRHPPQASHKRQRRERNLPIAAVILVWLFSLLLFASVCSADTINGFDLSDTLVPRNEIYHGGPGRDGIPSLDNPRFVNTNKTDFLQQTDRVLGLELGNEARAYPIKILNYHEIVNDNIDGQAVVISYCPLCGSGSAFLPPTQEGGNKTFGVSGLLYNSDLLLYDRETESLWSQIMGRAISGKLKGLRVTPLLLEHTTWADWQSRYPRTRVLSPRTGHFRDYNRHPYGNYDINSAVYFPLRHRSARYHPKEWVFGIEVAGQTRAYPVVELDKQGRSVIQDHFAGQALRIEYDHSNRNARIYDAARQALPVHAMFWFAWYAFHPDTTVFIGTIATN